MLSPWESDDEKMPPVGKSGPLSTHFQQASFRLRLGLLSIQVGSAASQKLGRVCGGREKSRSRPNGRPAELPLASRLASKVFFGKIRPGKKPTGFFSDWPS